MTFIKICGITTLEDAQLAIEVGADALGFNFFRGSKRYLEPSVARQILAELPSEIWKVGVFVNAPRKEVLEIAAESGIDTLQFHGDEAPESLTAWEPFRVIKAIRVGAQQPEAFTAVDRLLFDAYSTAEYGGTGEEIPVEYRIMLQPYLPTAFLAGGLTPENVQSRVESLRPWGVDVASGVEHSVVGKEHRVVDREHGVIEKGQPIRKDPEKLRAFAAAVRRAKL